MSNNYTADQGSAMFDQVSKVMELVREGQRPSEVFSGALQAIISDDDITVVSKVTQTPTGKIFHITSDAKIRSATDAVNATDCPVKWGLAEKPVEIPMIIHPVDCQARLIPLGQTRTTEEIYQIYPKMLTPAEFFAFGAKFPNEQRENPVFTIWLDGVGQFWYAVLNVRGVQRRVIVDRDRPDVEWDERYCVSVRE